MKKKTAINHALKFLCRKKYEIIDRGLARSTTDSRRSFVDLVVWDRLNECMIFIEVVPHRTQSRYQRRIVSLPKEKRSIQRKAIRSWLRVNRWNDDFRFDIVDVYGADDDPNPVIDHIFDIKIFKKK